MQPLNRIVDLPFKDFYARKIKRRDWESNPDIREETGFL
jgi:hypothetical protein